MAFLKKRLFRLHAHFTVELLLFLILAFTVGANLSIRKNSARASLVHRSLFFAHLKENPTANERLLETFEAVNLKLSQKHTLDKQILAASTKAKNQAQESGLPATSTSVPLPTLSSSTLLKPNPASNSGLATKRDIEIYKVRGGDTVTRIASAYGVSVNTILWENNLSPTTYIRPGQELKILPINGVRHMVKEGETLTSIAKKYGITEEEDIEEIFEFNEIEIEDHISPGEEIIIPNGIKKVPVSPQRRQYLAELRREDYKTVPVPADYEGASNELVWPVPATRRLSQKYWSRHLAIDIPCRDCEIVAAADGIIELSGWQKGYGNTILINHGKGISTRYGHGKENLVSAGDHVKQGQPIMTSGRTGRATGPHLHFEVKQNGKLVNPLNIIR